MRRPRRLWSRALVAIWGIWFAAALLEPGGLHSCPVHGGAGHVHVHGATHAMHGMQANASGDNSNAEHVAGTGSPSHHSSDVCTCLGLCCCAPAVALAGRAPSLPAETTANTTAPTHRDIVAPRLRRAHALPFANGPPTLVG